MASYLSSQELIARLNAGKNIEQWFPHAYEAGEAIIKWLTIYKEDQQFRVAYSEAFDEGGEDFLDVYEFSVVDPDNDPFEDADAFDSVEEAMAFASEKYGASTDKFVDGGMIQEEYAKYLHSINSPS